MHPLPIDNSVVDECRALAGDIAAGVQRFIDAHTTVSIERTVLRAYGIDGADAEGVPLVNSCVDRYLAAGGIGRGIAWWLGRALARGAADPQEAAEALAYGGDVDDGKGGPARADIEAALAPHTAAALERIDRARDKRKSDQERLGTGPIPWKYV
ncbi:MAG: L-beta-lysine 5,6-aminomutase alpha subunit, partial [bacterium]|nr:L-beta-lysine 5,6-aminomutase alpha subunit [bacterium]